MKTRILASLIALFAISLSGLSVSYAADFEWGDTAALNEHLKSHLKFPATGKRIKDSEQRAYIDSKLKDDTNYKNPEEVLSALNLKQSKRQ